MPIPNTPYEALSQMLDCHAAITAELKDTDDAGELASLKVIMLDQAKVPSIVNFFEWGYAKRALLSAEARAAIADVGAYATAQGWLGLAENDRGQLIDLLLRGQALPEGSAEPALAPMFQPPPPTMMMIPIENQGGG